MATEQEFSGNSTVNHSFANVVRHCGYKSKSCIVFDLLEIVFKCGRQLNKHISIMQNKYKLGCCVNTEKGWPTSVGMQGRFACAL